MCKIEKRIILVLFLVLSVLIFSNITFAAEERFAISLDPQAFYDEIPQPVKDFVEGAKSLSVDIAGRSASLSFESVNPSGWFDSADNWFKETTGGVSLRDALKFIGSFFAWILSGIAELLRWAISFL